MRLENEKYSKVVNISGGEHSGGWTFRGVNFPGGETSWGETVGGVNHPGGESSGRWIIRRGEKQNYEGVNRPGVNHKRGETSGIRYIYMCIIYSPRMDIIYNDQA